MSQAMNINIIVLVNFKLVSFLSTFHKNNKNKYKPNIDILNIHLDKYISISGLYVVVNDNKYKVNQIQKNSRHRKKKYALEFLYTLK